MISDVLHIGVIYPNILCKSTNFTKLTSIWQYKLLKFDNNM